MPPRPRARRRRSRAGGSLMSTARRRDTLTDLAGAGDRSACCSRCCRSTCSATSCAPASHRPAAAGRAKSLVVVLTVVRRRAQIVDRSVARRDGDGHLAGRAAAAAAVATPAALVPDAVTAVGLGARPGARRRRQADARPQLRPGAGQPRRRRARAVHARPAPDLHRLPDHARRVPGRAPELRGTPSSS